MSLVEPASPARRAARDVRRQQLIEATIKVLGQKGYASLTVADVARVAGLSTGIVIFHFNSKDEMLAATLQHLAIEYRQHWEAAMLRAGSNAGARLSALLLADFDTTVFTPEKLAAWIAFWGETSGRPTYDQICSALDRERCETTRLLCADINADGVYELDPALVMRTLESLCDGLWLGVAAHGAGHPGGVSAEQAYHSVMAALAAFFPRHFVQPKI